MISKVRVPALCKIALASLLLGVSCAVAFSQRNNPYAANPNPGFEPQEQPGATSQPVMIVAGDRPAIARQRSMIASSVVKRSTPLTEIYRVGVGDVLFINLKNAPNAAGYYTVRRDGTIEFPLAGESPAVVDKTIDQIEGLLAAAITLYSNPQIEVKVREYVSHKIIISGMAERVGEVRLQREALPLFVIRAEALVSSAATKVNIRRQDVVTVEAYDLRDEKTGDVLVYPGDAVEFTTEWHAPSVATIRFFYIAGEVNLTGQKEFIDGMTLFQAVTASGGTKGDPNRATLRRKGDKGMLNVAEYDLRAIRDGKASDPALQPGDMIEISN